MGRPGGEDTTSPQQFDFLLLVLSCVLPLLAALLLLPLVSVRHGTATLPETEGQEEEEEEEEDHRLARSLCRVSKVVSKLVALLLLLLLLLLSPTTGGNQRYKASSA